MIKFFSSIIMCIVCVLGSFATIDLYNESTQTNAILNDYNYESLYEDFSVLDVTLENVAFYEDKEAALFYHETTFNIEDDNFNKYGSDFVFDGTKNKYNLIVNGKPCNYTVSEYGLLYGYYILNYYNVYGEIVCSTPLDIYYTFFEDKIVVRINACINDSQYSYLLNYLDRNDIHLVLLDEVCDTSPSDEVTEKVFVRYVVDNKLYHSSIINVDSLTTAPENPTKEGFNFLGWAVEGTREVIDFSTYSFSANTVLVPIFSQILDVTFTKSYYLSSSLGFVLSDGFKSFENDVFQNCSYFKVTLNTYSTIKYNKAFTVTVPTPETYNFPADLMYNSSINQPIKWGWHHLENPTEGSVIPIYNISFLLNENRISIDFDGGSTIRNNGSLAGSKIAIFEIGCTIEIFC